MTICIDITRVNCCEYCHNCLLILFFILNDDHRDLHVLTHSFPTRRSSDLARTRDEVPLSTALGLMVRERLTGEAPPAAVAPGMALIQDWIEEKVGADLDALGLAIDDQIAFADLSKKIGRAHV